ncbi:hypothetical protein A9817_004287 [Escherichia coli]|nr:hypothetical protein [Escherichia coli]
MSRKPAVPTTELVALDELEDLATLRRDAARYRWLRERAVRINGSEVWWQGEYGPALRHGRWAYPGRI